MMHTQQNDIISIHKSNIDFEFKKTRLKRALDKLYENLGQIQRYFRFFIYCKASICDEFYRLTGYAGR